MLSVVKVQKRYDALSVKTLRCAVGSQRYRITPSYPDAAFLRLQLGTDDESMPLIVHARVDDPLPGLEDLALVCGTKQLQSAPVYDDGNFHDALDIVEGDGSITPLRSFRYSIVYKHEFLGSPNMDVMIGCPADLHIYDAEGHHTGAVYDSSGNVISIDKGIPNSFYAYGTGDTREIAIISDPISAYYTITVRGTASGVYTQTARIRNRGGFQTYTATVASVPTTNGQVSTTLIAEIPVAPTGLHLTRNGSTVNLAWNANSESDLTGYNVYRRSLPSGVYQRLSDSPLSSSAFSDSTALGAVVYYVTAVDTSHNESGHLAPITSGYLVYLPLVLRNQ